MKMKSEVSSRVVKFLIGTIFLIGMGISSIHVAFAEQDISTLLHQWFDQKKIEAVSTLQTTVGSEKDTQMIRLKEHLQSEMARAERELAEDEQQQITSSVAALRAHTDQLIASVKIDNTSEKQKVINELNAIYNETVTKMGSVELVVIPEEPDTENGNGKNEVSLSEETTTDDTEQGE